MKIAQKTRDKKQKYTIKGFYMIDAMKVICDKLKMYIINPTSNTKTFFKRGRTKKPKLRQNVHNIMEH